MKTTDIHIRDPFVLPVTHSGLYYLFGTTDEDCAGKGTGFDCYRSRNLTDWEGPIPAFRPPPGFWSDIQYWAPEVHFFKGRYYMFATFKATQRYRGTQILVADLPEGPYQPWSDQPVTPQDWECLDGTLHIDQEGFPWIVFCHEWVQIHNGAMYALRLSEDLKQAVGRPVFLFNASEAPWGRASTWSDPATPRLFPVYVTDGPFLYRTANGSLLMLWSSDGPKGYAMGIARSSTGRVEGPWVHDPEALWLEDGGHGMIFRSFEGRLFMTLHQPNTPSKERPVFCELSEENNSLFLRPDLPA